MKVDWQKLGRLLPVIAQDAGDGAVLMLAYMNEEALSLTLQTGYAHYFSPPFWTAIMTRCCLKSSNAADPPATRAREAVFSKRFCCKNAAKMWGARVFAAR